MRIFKPFWSLNIKNIENWLSKKALEGYILKDVNLLLKLFIFEKGEKSNINYRISFEKRGITELQPSLIKNGWYKACSKGRWFFLANEKNLEDIKAEPSREPLLSRFKIAQILLSLIPIFLAVNIGIFLIFLIPMIIFYFLGIGDITFIKEVSPEKIQHIETSYFTLLDILNVIKALGIIALFIYPLYRLRKNELQIKEELGSDYVKFHGEFVFEKEDSLQEHRRLIGKRGPSFLEPDKLEKWLEDLEAKGFNLYKVKKGNKKFYFTKGAPRKIRYILDFQNNPTAAYYEIFKLDQWELDYTVGTLPVKWSLWSKEYTGERPNIYSNREEQVSNAKKMALTYSAFYLPTIAIISYSIIKVFILLISDISRTIEVLPYMVSIVLFLMSVLSLFCFPYSKIISFYVRAKGREY